MIISNIELTVNSLSKLIKLSWNKWTGEFSSYVLVKKRNSIPKNVKDGNLIYKGIEPYYEDTDIKNGEIYYYRLFIVLTEDLFGDIITDNKCVGKAIGFTNTSDYGSSLYSQVPEAVRYQDFKLKKDLPLKRFFQLISFPFDKLDMFSETQLKQLDIDECSEEYLPYHAKWMGMEYDQNFSSDINRLILKTWQEAEPYRGTSAGVAYLLQRIFKAEVKIIVDKYVDVSIIDVYIDDDSAWLLTHIESIKRLIRKYVALRTKWEIITNLRDNEYYETVAEAYDEFIEVLKEFVDEKYGNGNIKDAHISGSECGVLNSTEHLTNISLFTMFSGNKSIGYYAKDEYYDFIKSIYEDMFQKTIEDDSSDNFLTYYVETRYNNTKYEVLDLLTTLHHEIYAREMVDNIISAKISSITQELYDKPEISLTNVDKYLTNVTLFTPKKLKTDYYMKDIFFTEMLENYNNDIEDENILMLFEVSMLESYIKSKSETSELCVKTIVEDGYDKPMADFNKDSVSVVDSEINKINMDIKYKVISILKDLILESYVKSKSETLESYIKTTIDDKYDKSVMDSNEDAIFVDDSETNDTNIEFTLNDIVSINPQVEEFEPKTVEEIGCVFIYKRIGFTNSTMGLTNKSIYTCDKYYKNQAI